MPRRHSDISSETSDPPIKRNGSNLLLSSNNLKNGTVLKDVTGQGWKLGKAVGVGGFGEIYLASDNLNDDVKTDSKYVAKVESHKNGPLFVEMNCYLRIAKPEMIAEWKRKKKLTSLGMPHYVASGSHIYQGEKYRFLVLPKFEKDLEAILQEKKMLNLKTVLTISLQIIDVLEYIHSKGYIHSDVKASNILLSAKKTRVTGTQIAESLGQFQQKTKETKWNLRRSTGINYLDDIPDFEELLQDDSYVHSHVNRPKVKKHSPKKLQQKPKETKWNLRRVADINYLDDIPNFEELLEQDGNDLAQESESDQVFLLDYGLACKYVTTKGEHKPFCADERKAHAGTILFCSRDAHKGVASRRSDLESLGYNIVHWLTGNLPWSNDVDEPVMVEKKKIKAMMDIEYFLKKCFTEFPKFLEEYFKYLQKLQFQEKPDYNYCKKLFKLGLKTSGYRNDSILDFDNVQNRIKFVKKKVSENLKVRKYVYEISRPPLQSNIPVKPLLRKKVKNEKRKPTNWFEDITDPEEILKQGREKKSAEHHSELNIYELNPTYAMLEVYNRCREKTDFTPCQGDSSLNYVDGYTYAMMSVLKRIKMRQELESEALARNLGDTRRGKTRRCINHKNKFEIPHKSLTAPPATKSNNALKKPVFQGRKVKSGNSYRSNSLKG